MAMIGHSLSVTNPRLVAAGGAFSPAALFANGEQGAWYDPSDLTTLFQDDLGTTPAAYGAPVGLMLDKSKGAVRGPELVVGTGPFVKDTDATLAMPLAGAVAGKTYEIELVIEGKNVSGPTLIMGGTVTAMTEVGNFTKKVIWTPSTDPVGLFVGGPSARLTVQSASVREVAGNHASQPTVTARPTLGRVPANGRRNLLLYTELYAGTGQWVSTQPFDLTPVEVLPGILGVVVSDPASRRVRVYDRTNSQWIVSATPWPISQGRFSLTFTAPSGCVEANVYLNTITSEHGQIYSHASNSVVVPGETYTVSYHVNGDRIGGVQVDLGTEMTPYQKVTSPYDVTEAGVPSLHYLDFDGVDDRLMLATPLHRPNVDWMQGFRRSTLHTMAMLSNNNLSAYIWAMAQGTSTTIDNNAGTPQYYADGSQITTLTRRGLSDAIPLDTSKVLEARGADLTNATAWSEMGIGATGWSEFKAHVYGVIMRDAMTADERDNAREWLADRSGVTL